MLNHHVYTAVAAVFVATVCLTGTTLAAADSSRSSSPVDVLETYRQPESLRHMRDLEVATIRPRASAEVQKTNASLDLSWSNAELFNYEWLSVSCVSCYVKGNAYATLTVSPNFDISSALETLAGDFVGEIDNITDTAWNTFKNWTEAVVESTTATIVGDVDCIVSGACTSDELKDVDWDALAFPTIPVDFDIDVNDIPGATIELKFDEFELYLELDISLDASSSYTIPLYPNKPPYQPAGFEIGKQKVGIVISLELILALDAEVDISTGVHVKFDDGLSMELALFGSSVSSVNLSPGTFEFLPVTVSTTGLTLDATLRLGVTAGMQMNDTGLADFDIEAGASAEVFADIAHFKTNITPSDTSIGLKARDDTDYSSDCELPVIETYEFGLGAQAGAYIAVLNNTWGPLPSASLQIYYTTLYSACAVSASATGSSDPSSTSSAGSGAKRTAPAYLAARDGTSSTMGTATSEYTLTNVVCQTAGLSACPASLQTTSQTTKTSTYTSMVPSGVDLTFPATTGASVSAKAFGSGAQSVSASSGSPVSYVPPTTTTNLAGSIASGINGAIDGAKDGVDGFSKSHRKLTIGLSVGIGLGAVLIGLAVLATFCIRRRRERGGQGRSGPLMAEKASEDDFRPFLPETPPSQWPKWDSSSKLGTPQIHERALYDEPTAYVSPRQPGAAM